MTGKRRYVHGPGVDEPLVQYEGAGTSDRRWLMADQLGSVIAATNAAGALIGAPNTYDEYGTPAASNTGRFQYTGQIWLAEAGLYHYKARAYAPTLGRFLQADPILYAGGMNLYMCVGNDPINFTDPLGLQAWEGNPDDDIIVGPPISPHWPESRVLWEVWKLFPPHIDGPAGAGEARERVRAREKQGDNPCADVPAALAEEAIALQLDALTSLERFANLKANADWDLLDRALVRQGGEAASADNLEIPADLLARVKPSKRR